MPYAEDLRSSEPPEIPMASSSSGEDELDSTRDDDQQNIGLLAAAAATHTSAVTPSTHQHRYRTPQSLSEGASPETSVLGRRQRDSASEMRTGRDKVRIETFTRDTCAAMGVPTAERDEMLIYSQLQTHELLIVYLCKAAADRQVTRDTALNTYLKSPEFKEYVTGRLRCMLLDPKLSTYKVGVLERVMRHIRLNPGQYQIPPELRVSIPSKIFIAAVSSALTNARSFIKQKLSVALTAKRDIYRIVKDLAVNPSQEFSDDVWGRWAWIHLMLSDFPSVVEKSKSATDSDEKALSGKDFWSWLDKLLNDHREKYATLPEGERAVAINKLFARSLKRHITEFPATKKPRTRAWPAWQVELSGGVNEMEGYELGQLAVRDEHEPELDEE